MPAAKKNKKNKNKQQKKSKQQRKKDRNKKRKQKKKVKNKKQNGKNTVIKNNEYCNLTHKSLIEILKKSCNELTPSNLQILNKSRKNLKFKQSILAECFDIIWKKCVVSTDNCTEMILSKKLTLLQILCDNYDLNLNKTQNYFSLNDNDTLFNRICLLCNKCLLPMLQICSEYININYNSYNEQLILLILQQLNESLYLYQTSLGIKFEKNILQICDMSWMNILLPTLTKWYHIQYQLKSIVPWTISQGVYLDVILPYFNVFIDYIIKDCDNGNIDYDINNINDNSLYNPLNVILSNNQIIEELCIPKYIYEQLMKYIGTTYLRRKKAKDIVNDGRIFDRDLEYIYLNIADLFDEGRLRWLRTDKGIQVYTSYVNIVNNSIDAKYPLIGKLITDFIIGSGGMIIV